MTHPAAELARAAADSFRDLAGFEATQTIHAGPINVSARIRSRRPDCCSAEFTAYTSPLLDAEDRLAHGVEFLPEELVGMTLVHDGRRSIAIDPKTETALLREGRFLAEPLPGFQAIGELGFLETLTRDFLLRDDGTETINGCSAHRIGLRPKYLYRSQLLRSVSLPVRRAALALDAETRFPLQIQFFPSRGTVLASLTPPNEPITVTYERVRLEPPEPDVFDLEPLEGSRRFTEELLAMDELADRLSFPCDLESVTRRGFRPADGRVHLLAEENANRSYITVTLLPETGRTEEAVLTLRVGNYLSRTMGRRKARLSEEGRDTSFDEQTGRILDRADELPDNEAKRSMYDLFWQRDDVYWFLSTDGLAEEEAIEIASELAKSEESAD